jgi:hypothetical protein
MDKERMKLLNRLFGATQIVVALFYFDFGDTNKLIVSVLLFVGGVLCFLLNSESALLRTIHTVLCYVGFLLAIGLIVKVLFGW